MSKPGPDVRRADLQQLHRMQLEVLRRDASARRAARLSHAATAVASGCASSSLSRCNPPLQLRQLVRLEHRVRLEDRPRIHAAVAVEAASLSVLKYANS